MKHGILGAKSAALFQMGPKASFLQVVKSLPFWAKFEQIHVTTDSRGVSTEKRVSGNICRDSAGRVRREVRAEGKDQESPELVIIADVTARTATILDVLAKLAVRFTEMGPPPGKNANWGWGFSGPWSLQGAREERIIEGVVCRKARRVVPPLLSAGESAETGEVWVSDELKYSVLERVTDPERGAHTWRLFDIRRIEPPSVLFDVPVGYTEVVRSKTGSTPPTR
jgi:hypothetical protein